MAGVISSVSLVQRKQNIEGKAASNSVNLTLNPSAQTLAPNTPSSVLVSVNTNNSSISAVNLEIQFDPTFIQFNSAIVGNVLSAQVKPLQVQGDKATIVLAAACTTTCAIFNGNGLLATLNFTTLNTQGQTQVSISPTTQVSVVGINNNTLDSQSSATITVTDTTADTNPPAVSITSPPNGSTVERRSHVSITANATDNVAISQVVFYVNNTQICLANAAPYICNWTVPAKPRTTYRISAIAKDSANNSTNSPEISVTVP